MDFRFLLLEKLGSRNFLALLQLITFGVKVSFFLFLFVWIRWTVPRFRYDQLMNLGWRTMIPLGLFNIIATAVLLYLVEGV